MRCDKARYCNNTPYNPQPSSLFHSLRRLRVVPSQSFYCQFLTRLLAMDIALREELLAEGNCLGRTWERAYYKCGDRFLKRSLRPQEFKAGELGLHVPRLGKEKLMNEAASLRFIAENTNIPVPAFCDEFEDNGAYCLVTRYVDGVKMTELSLEEKKTVIQEIEVHLASLRRLQAATIGGPSGHVIPPYRVSTKTKNDIWNLRTSTAKEYVFCHNDLSQQNIIVDPATCNIKAIIDWEFAGFYPAWFEMPLYKRLDGAPGSIARGDEVDDTAQVLEFLMNRSHFSQPQDDRCFERGRREPLSKQQVL